MSDYWTEREDRLDREMRERQDRLDKEAREGQYVLLAVGAVAAAGVVVAALIKVLV